MIGRIAVRNLSERGKGYVMQVLGIVSDLESDILPIGRWADSLNDWTSSLHFVNVPYHHCTGFEAKRDCGKECTVYAMANYVADVMDPNASRQDKNVAMKMLIHLMGDLHNPVHMGFREDRGGNDIPITIEPAPKFPANLHNVWDFHLLVRFNRKAFVESVEPRQIDPILDKLSASTNKLTYHKLKDAFIEIATETSVLVCNAYRHVDGRWIKSGDTLETAYWDGMQKVAQGQIRKAGIRLAKLIDIMATHEHSADAGFSTKPHHERPQELVPEPHSRNNVGKKDASTPAIFIVWVCIVCHLVYGIN
jgi:hypothetical protein